jgi:hypothetical protein
MPWRLPRVEYVMRDYPDWPLERADHAIGRGMGGARFRVRTVKDWVILSALRRRFGGDFSEVLGRPKHAPAVVGIDRMQEWAAERSCPSSKWVSYCRGGRACLAKVRQLRMKARGRDREMAGARRLKGEE